MKTCPFCAEEIQDAAIKCRYCGSDLPTASDPDRPEFPVVSGVEFTHRGKRYLLGAVPRGDVMYGIWDARASGKALERFRYTNRGWEKAYARFCELEPEHWLKERAAIKCPTCGSENVEKFIGWDKAAAVALAGIFALVETAKSFNCLVCGYRW